MADTTQLIVMPEKHELIVKQGKEEETYQLDVSPSTESSLVLSGKEEILHELELNEVITNLNNSAGLMFVAYNALAGTQIQHKISGLQKNLLDLCSNCIVAVQDFDNKSSEVLGYIVHTYRWLIKGQEMIALKQLDRCGKTAAAMAGTADELAKGFTQIAGKTEDALEDSQKEENLQYEKIDKIKAELRELEADKEEKIKLKEGLVTEIGEMQHLYDEAKSREKVESNRAFLMGMTSMVTSAVGAGIGAFASMSNPVASMMASCATDGGGSGAPDSVQAEKIKEKSAQMSEAEKEAVKLEKKAEEKEAAAQAAEKEFKKAQSNAEKADKDAADKAQKAESSGEPSEKKEAEEAKHKAELKKKLAEHQSEAAKLKKAEAEKAKEKAGQKRAAAKELKKALSELSKATARMQDQALKAAASVHGEKMMYLDKKLALEKQRRETLSTLAKYTKLIENAAVDQNNATTAVQTLHVAVRCLKQIVTSLTTAALFWRSMEQFCMRVSDPKLAKQIEDRQGLTMKDRLEEYNDPEFMYTAVSYMARWVALNSVCKEYLAAVNEAYHKVEHNIEQAPTREEAWANAPILAKEINDSVDKQMAALDVSSKALEKEKQNL